MDEVILGSAIPKLRLERAAMAKPAGTANHPSTEVP
jgi:hypothetical protein